MVPETIKCKSCAADIEVKTWRKFVQCPFCGNRIPFEGFTYQTIDWKGSKYAKVKKWMDCPACRSKNMYLGPSGMKWLCPDCGYSISNLNRLFGVFWFCDECDAYLNVQDGFTTKKKKWTCTECGHVNGVTRKDIL